MASSTAPHGPLPKIPEGAGKLQLGAIIFPGVDLLDLMGPMRIYGSQRHSLDIKINFLAPTLEPFMSEQQVKLTPDYAIVDAPKMDIIFIPGGFGYGNITENPEVHKRLKSLIEEATWCFTVCNGAGILASTGLVDGYNLTTNKAYFDKIIGLGPKVNWIKRARWVQDGKYVSSSEVSAGIDASLYVVSQLVSQEDAEKLASLIEYSWHRKADEDPFADLYPYTRL
ncbi:hypothetical protein BGZ72_007368 [Mortierella alpina]|nr:hypothetical protein BGZ72_007368 [Mortierella alpina]